jgi:hypothetical protein
MEFGFGLSPTRWQHQQRSENEKPQEHRPQTLQVQGKMMCVGVTPYLGTAEKPNPCVSRQSSGCTEFIYSPQTPVFMFPSNFDIKSI